jgi:uncharacterized spore protein YtfJ
VFGDPIHVEGKTVVPVAKVAYGFGGGAREEGGGGGGGVRAFPAGALEITPEGTRFIPFPDFRWFASVFAAGVLLGIMMRKR